MKVYPLFTFLHCAGRFMLNCSNVCLLILEIEYVFDFLIVFIYYTSNLIRTKEIINVKFDDDRFWFPHGIDMKTIVSFWEQ